MHLIYVILWILICVLAGVGIGFLRGNLPLGITLIPLLSFAFLDLFCLSIAANVCRVLFVVIAAIFVKRIWQIWRKKTPRRKHPKTWISITGTVVIALIMVMLYVANFAISAFLVPDFMTRLDAFESITETSVSQQVHTDDITENHKAAVEETNEWLETVDYEKATVTTEDGYSLDGVIFYTPEESHTWVLFAHGYTGWKEEMYPFACHYAQMGYQCLCSDCRTAGDSEGDYIGMGYLESRDMLQWIDWILDKDPQAKIVLHGQSMGGATVLQMAGMTDLPDCVVAVVSDCAYSDAYEMFQLEAANWLGLKNIPDWMLEFVCTTFRLRGGYNLHDASPIKTIENAKVPILFIHGDSDSFVPTEMAYELYEKATCPKELLIVEGAGHAQSQDKDPDTYYGTVEKFLDKYVE